MESRGTLWPRLGVSGARMCVRGSALDSCAQEQFERPAQVACRNLKLLQALSNKKREGHEQFTDLLRSPDTILHDCKRSHGHPGPANRARNVWQFGWQFGSNSRQFGRFSSNSGSGRRQKCGEGGNSVPQSLAFNNLKHTPRTVQRPERHSGRVFSYFAKQCVGFLEFYHAVLVVVTFTTPRGLGGARRGRRF